MDTFDSLIMLALSMGINKALIVKPHDHCNLIGELHMSNYSTGSCSSLLTFDQNLSSYLQFTPLKHQFHNLMLAYHYQDE